jgi:hypothetical protein
MRHDGSGTPLEIHHTCPGKPVGRCAARVGRRAWKLKMKQDLVRELSCHHFRRVRPKFERGARNARTGLGCGRSDRQSHLNLRTKAREPVSASE